MKLRGSISDCKAEAKSQLDRLVDCGVASSETSAAVFRADRTSEASEAGPSKECIQ